VHCAGSIREESTYPDISGEAAIDGTGSHQLLEDCLIHGRTAESYLDQVIGVNNEDKPEGWIVKADRIERVNMGLNYINRRIDELTKQFPSCTITVEAESRSNPGTIYGRDDWYGTCDITITVEVDSKVVFIEIADYKDGRGYVSEKDNSQLMAYAGGKMIDQIDCDLPRKKFDVYRVKDVETIRQTIIQPKTRTPIRYFDYQPSTVLSKLDELNRAAEAADDPNAPLKAGDWCTWCKANPKRGGHCTTAASESIEKVKQMTGEIIASDGVNLFELVADSLDKVDTLTNEQLRQLMDVKDSFGAIFDRVTDTIVKRIDEGQKVPGYGMKPGKGSKVWNVSEEELEKFLKNRKFKKDEIRPPKLISPAQALKHPSLTKKQKEDLEKLITVKVGASSLGKVALETLSVEEMFKPVEQTSTTVLSSTPSVFDDGMNPVEPDFSFL
jgi:hypothetical protein